MFLLLSKMTRYHVSNVFAFIYVLILSNKQNKKHRIYINNSVIDFNFCINNTFQQIKSFSSVLSNFPCQKQPLQNNGIIRQRKKLHSFQILINISKIMQLGDKHTFLHHFFDFEYPQAQVTQFTEEEFKNNDMKISLEIATRSTLRMQSDPKTNLVSFSCKNYGKNCFEIFASRKNGFYVIDTNFENVKHERSCQLRNQGFEYLKIYNLMKLKKNLIEAYMVEKDLINCSPSQILSEISEDHEYFFQKNINYNSEMRRKLRKRFDNIINIDIKKITKGGRQQESPEKLPKNSAPQALKQVLTQKKDIYQQEQFNSQYEPDQTSVFNEERAQEKKFKRIDKKKKKKKEKRERKYNLRIQEDKEENTKIPRADNLEGFFKKSCDKIDHDEIYVNPASQIELKQIKELKQEFNGFEYIFPWCSDDSYQPVFPETINEKVDDNVFQSLRNSLLKRPLQAQSISNFPQNMGNLNDFNDYDEAI